MAIDSFCVSIELTEEERYILKRRLRFRENTYFGDLVYKNAILIREKENVWNLTVGYCNFFDNCYVLFELCELINEVKPDFEFQIFKIISTFWFKDAFRFLEFVYSVVKPYKEYYNHSVGTLMILPGGVFNRFRRKNRNSFYI